MEEEKIEVTETEVKEVIVDLIQKIELALFRTETMQWKIYYLFYH